MRFTRKSKFFLGLIAFNLIIFAMMLSSEYVEEWFTFTSVPNCNWKGNNLKIYSSNCYTHEIYSDTECNVCPCCFQDNLTSMLDLEAASVCLTINFAVVLSWIWINIFLNIIKIITKFGLYWKLYCIFYIFFGIVSCFLTGSSHPSDVNLKEGYVFRLTVILLYYLVGFAHLVYACRKIIKSNNQETDSEENEKELIEGDKLEVKGDLNVSSNEEVNIQ